MALAISLGVSPQAEAVSWSPYCNNQTLGGSASGNAYCYGAYRTLHAEYGWGDQHSVCVFDMYNAGRCSSGPGAGVYNPTDASVYWVNVAPAIYNNAAGWNVVHASAEVP